MREHSCQVLKGVGPKQLERLQKCGIHNLHDLLFHLPIRFEDKTKITPMRQLRSGKMAQIEGTITEGNFSYGKRRSYVCQLADEGGTMEIRYYHINCFQIQSLAVGKTVRCYGEVRFIGKRLAMIHPEYVFIDSEKPEVLEERLTAVYPSTEGLNQKSIRKFISQALVIMQQDLQFTDYLIDILKESMPDLPALHEAVAYLHSPPQDADCELLLQGKHPCQQRLAFEKLLIHTLAMKKRRAQRSEQKSHTLL